MKMNVLTRRIFLVSCVVLTLHQGHRTDALENELLQIRQQVEQCQASEMAIEATLEELLLQQQSILEKKEQPQQEHFQKEQPQKEQPQIETVSVHPALRSLGVFTATAYCKENYPHICNNGNALSTATGTTPTAGRTIAVDPKVIPLGAKVIINGHTYIAEDTGGAIKGKRIDIVFDTHAEALQFGRRQVEVFVEG